MSAVSPRTLRGTVTGLRAAASGVKGALRGRRTHASPEADLAVEESRVALREALNLAAIAKRQAQAQGLQVSNLTQAMSKAARWLTASEGESLTGSPWPTPKAKGKGKNMQRAPGAREHRGPQGPPAPPHATAGAGGSTATNQPTRAGEAGPSRGRAGPQGPQPAQAGAQAQGDAPAPTETLSERSGPKTHPPSQASKGSRESQLSLREELARATHDEEVAAAKRRYLTEMVAIDEARSSRGRRSKGSAHSSSPSDHRSRTRPAATAKSKAKDKGKGTHTQPIVPPPPSEEGEGGRTASWVADAAKRTRTGSVSEDSLIEVAAKAVARAVKAKALPNQSPKGKRWSSVPLPCSSIL